MIYAISIRTENHRMVWVASDLKDHPVPAPLSWAGTPFTDQAAQSEWSWTLSGMGKWI